MVGGPSLTVGAADAAPRGRRAVVRRVVLAVGLVGTVVGGIVMWQAVDRLDDTEARAALARRDMEDLRAVIRARLDETLGRHDFDAAYPTGDAELEEHLGYVVEAAEDPDAAAVGESIVTAEAELRDRAEATSGADEVLLFSLRGDLDELERLTVRVRADDARAAEDAARRTVVAVFVPLSILWAAAASSCRVRG